MTLILIAAGTTAGLFLWVKTIQYFNVTSDDDGWGE